MQAAAVHELQFGEIDPNLLLFCPKLTEAILQPRRGCQVKLAGEL
jgi:hypothetical protein